MKKIITLISLSFLLMMGMANGQTNVSGGIYSNTTWTLINSPYIVTDTVVVFPSITLTIEPGVVVKFDDGKFMEFRQAAMIANGTITDSITFTSNSNAPFPGIWKRIWFNGGSMTNEFNYINVYYCHDGIAESFTNTDTMFLHNSTFRFNISSFSSSWVGWVDSCIFKNNNAGLGTNQGYIRNCEFLNNIIGVGSNAPILNCIIDSNQLGVQGCHILRNCIVKYNGTGINSGEYVDSSIISLNDTGFFSMGTKIQNCIIDSNNTYGISIWQTADSVINCKIRYNGIGIFDSSDIAMGYTSAIYNNVIDNNNIGVIFGTDTVNFYCNEICNNTLFDIKTTVHNGANGSLANNYWCTTDSATIQTYIYDGYDNINLGLFFFMPIDTIACNMITGINSQLSTPGNQFVVYPNPASTQLTISNLQSANNQLSIIDVLGNEVYHQPIPNSTQSTIDISQLSNGVYFYQLTNNKETVRGKFVKQ